MESFRWENRDGMTSRDMFHVLVHVNKPAVRYHDSNFWFVELSKNTKRPHFLWVSRPKPVAKPEIMKMTKWCVWHNHQLSSDFLHTGNTIWPKEHVVSIWASYSNGCLRIVEISRKKYSDISEISRQVLLKIFGKSVDARLARVRTLYSFWVKFQ